MDPHKLADERHELAALLDRNEAFRSALDQMTDDGDVAWIAEPDSCGGVILRAVRGELTGQLRGLSVPSGLGLTGKVYDSSVPAWVNDYFQSGAITHNFDRQIRSEHVTRLLAVPIMHGAQQYGVLAVGARSDGLFGDRAIDRARYVADRSALALSVVDRARAERDIAVQEERNRIAVELHDTVGALLYAIGSGVTGVAAESGDPAIAPQLEQLQSQIAEASTALRDSLRALRASPSTLALSAAFKTDCSAFSDRTGIPAELVMLDDPPDLPSNRAEALIATVREALLNVEKHADASAAVITVSRGGTRRIIVAVTDDGIGIASDQSPGVGLTTTRDTVGRLGGSLNVTSDPHGGTMFRVELPC